MNVLILTGRFGMGHIRCAQAIEERIRKEYGDVKVDIVDLPEYLSPMGSRVIYCIFNMVVKHMSGIYNRLSRLAEKVPAFDVKHTAVRGMDHLMEEYRPDLVVSVLPLCGRIYSGYRRHRGIRIPMYTYVTDITLHSEWLCELTEKYFVGDQAVKEELIRRGVKEEDIIICGIPVSMKFAPKEREDHRAKVLVMGGGLGLVPGGDEMLFQLNAMEEADVTLVAGRNEKLKSHVESLFPGIHTLGFTGEVERLMNEADVVITKPGGITTFEAISAGTPIYAVGELLEQEKGNAEYIVRKRIGHVEKERFDGKHLSAFLANQDRIRNMKENMREITSSYGCSNPVTVYMEEYHEKAVSYLR